MRARAATLAVGLLLAPASALAQASALDQVEELASAGRTEEARTALTEWWGSARDGSSQRDLQRGLWLRGRLTVDPAQAELDFQRLVVLYPASPYAPQALFRLGQSAHARGDGEGARRHVDQLVRDYPTSPSRSQAETWLRSAGPLPAAATAGGLSAAGAAASSPPPSPPAQSDVSPSTIRPSTGRAPAPADVVLDWCVQFGAFSDEERAVALQGELVSAGLAARLVRVQGSGFLHVRIGRYATREEAARQLDQLTRQGYTAAIVRDDRAEEVVRR